MIAKGATFSKDMRYRYKLWRVWNPDRPTITFVMLNPTTADENVDDPTVKRCIGYAVSWRYGALYVLNLFALRSTDPIELTVSRDESVGPGNDGHLQAIRGDVVAAWGSWGRLYGRGQEVRSWLRDPRCFGLTKAGQPLHPLYLHSSRGLVPFTEHGGGQ